MIGIKITGADATGRNLQALSARLANPDGLSKVVGRLGVNLLKDHFRSRNATPNKLGGRRTNYWQRVADSVQDPRVGNGEVRISINEPTFAQKVFGGTITPKAAKALTIPVNPAAHGVTAAVLESEIGTKLFLVKKNGGSALGVLAARLGESKELTVFYVLVASVDQAPDPDALPPFESFASALVKKAEEYVARVTKNPTQEPSL